MWKRPEERRMLNTIHGIWFNFGVLIVSPKITQIIYPLLSGRLQYNDPVSYISGGFPGGSRG